ncbi:zinc ABC transporter substrate-binding protein [Candidatus Cerribacteria bacterium 'Amazon FNV 2010 28 9']|uniref:Zinc ABC transporter substrate-binding protein n=1 Tax=Candidatus Cerribacteria bacterium 'Amazon FNV 2010 28 9' TaxID=2081795 RepID=A0A317JP60_9BACT|nr:MAG: zinc ABC transporter substrate-binding protein [Candidatus Cerribacteria bacterium 'Amazon FNV 2010 28 9']
MYMMKKYITLCVVAFAAVVLLFTVATTTKQTSTLSTDKRLHITTSFYPLYFFASQIVGSHADVINITPSGAEPHDYEPTPQDILSINKSQLLFLNGGNLEAWGEKIQQIIDPKQTTVVTIGADITTQTVDEDGKTIIDPHVWLSPKLAEVEVKRIENAIEAKDPANKNTYQQNATALLEKLNTLDTEYTQGLRSCTQHTIVTSHAAFGYLATEYHLTQLPIAGLSPDEEPSAQQMASIAQFAKEHQIHTIFFESLVSPKLSQTIASEIGAQTLVLDPIEGVSKQESQEGKNYFTIMEDNLRNLRMALQCH